MSEDMHEDMKGYNLSMNIFSISAYYSADKKHGKSIIQAIHAGEALEIFYTQAKKDSIGRWPIPMSVEHIGELENPKLKI